jgi:hypothetical protein
MQRIPKIIHYCWFGPKPFPELEQKCMESWKRYLSDYEYKLWDETSFDIDSVTYVKQAYECKKYAFVSDYVRMYALYTFGGIYLDTDVEILQPLDSFLEDEVFMGFENKTMLGTAIIGTIKDCSVFSDIMNYYHQHKFLDDKHRQDTTANPQLLVNSLIKQGFKKENLDQFIGNIHIYERDIFFPKKLGENNFRVTERTIAIHHFTGSWLSERDKKRGINKFWIDVCRPVLRKIQSILSKLLGEKLTKRLEIIVRDKLR